MLTPRLLTGITLVLRQ